MKLSAGTTNRQLIDLMMSRLGERKSPELRARLVLECNIKINEIEQGPTLPWFLETETTFDTVYGQRAYDLPEDFLREVEQGTLIVSQNGVPLGASVKVDYEDLNHMIGEPVTYALFGERLYFGSIPDGVYTCDFPYFMASTDLVDNEQPVTNVWLITATNYVTLLTLRQVANFHIQSADLALRFDAELKDVESRFWRMVEARRHANADYKIED